MSSRERAELALADAGEGERIEHEHHVLLAPERRQRDVVAVLVLQREVGVLPYRWRASFVAFAWQSRPWGAQCSWRRAPRSSCRSSAPTCSPWDDCGRFPRSTPRLREVLEQGGHDDLHVCTSPRRRPRTSARGRAPHPSRLPRRARRRVRSPCGARPRAGRRSPCSARTGSTTRDRTRRRASAPMSTPAPARGRGTESGRSSSSWSQAFAIPGPSVTHEIDGHQLPPRSPRTTPATRSRSAS